MKSISKLLSLVVLVIEEFGNFFYEAVVNPYSEGVK